MTLDLTKPGIIWPAFHRNIGNLSPLRSGKVSINENVWVFHVNGSLVIHEYLASVSANNFDKGCNGKMQQAEKIAFYFMKW